MPLVWHDWLPEPLAEQVKTDEPKRFAALVDALHDQWFTDKASLPITVAAGNTIPFVSLVKGMVSGRTAIDAPVVLKLTKTLLDIVLSCEDDLAPQARWAAQLHRVLRLHRKKLLTQEFTVPWRPLYQMLRKKILEPSPLYEGAGVAEARRSSLVRVLHRARRFFAPGSAEEIWNEFGHLLKDQQRPEAFEALGWLAMLMPTQHAKQGHGPWGEWAQQWLLLWGGLSHGHYWQALWLNLFSRLAKHDTTGLVPWRDLLPDLFTKFMWGFHVPVGTATTEPPFSIGAPALTQALFNDDIKSRSGCVAKAAVYLLGRVGVEEGLDDPALSSLERLVALLEQYYHPSNTGRWTPSLSSFLRMTTHHFSKRLVAEHTASILSSNEHGLGSDSDNDEGEDDDADPMAEDAGDDDSDDDSDDEVDLGTHMDSSSSEDDEENGNQLTSKIPDKPNRRRPLPESTRSAVVSLLLKLASKGQSSKDRGLVRNSAIVLSTLAYIEPEKVLPVVHTHFDTALSTVTASSQLATAIQTLSLCVRPMLLAGLAPSDTSSTAAASNAMVIDSGSGNIHVNTTSSNGGGFVNLEEKRKAAAHAIASAMMATLPGIDANDPPKSLAVFRLYCTVLSCIGQLPEDANAPNSIPLYTEEWSEELLSRIFTVIGNLDAPEQRSGEHGGRGEGLNHNESASFLLAGTSMFRPLLELLYSRLPADAKRIAINRTCQFLLTSTFTSVTAEAAILCNAITWADPDVASKTLFQPLLTMLEADAAGILREKASGRLSKVQETAIKWRLNLLASTGYHMGPALVQHKQSITNTLNILADAPSQAVQEATTRTVSSLMAGLVTYYPLGQYRTHDSTKTVLGIEAYVDKNGVSVNEASAKKKPQWHVPSEAELKFAEEMLTLFLEQPSRQIIDASSSSAGSNNGSALNRDALRALLLRMEGALGGVRSCLPDLPGAQSDVEGSLNVIGSSGPSIGSSDLRAYAAQASMAAIRLMTPTDTDTGSLILRVMDGILAVGSAEYGDSDSGVTAWNSDERYMMEPAVAGLLWTRLKKTTTSIPPNNSVEQDKQQIEGGVAICAASEKWRRRRPRWLMEERVNLDLEWRASQAVYRWWVTAQSPILPLSEVPPLCKEMAKSVAVLVVKGYKGVRELAASVLERSLKRYMSMAPAVAAVVFAAMAKLDDVHLEVDWGRVPGDLIPLLREAGSRPISASTEDALEQESDQEQALAVGACTMMRGLSIWRTVARDWAGLHAFFLALMASMAHTGTEAQGAIAMASFALIFRFMRPPLLHPQHQSTPFTSSITTTTSQGPYTDAIILDAISVASGQRTHNWRYRALANGYPLLLLSAASPQVLAQLMQHYVSELTSEITVTRQLATSGVNVLSMSLWQRKATLAAEEPRPYVPEVADAVKNALVESLNRVVSSDAKWVEQLVRRLANAHTNLAGGQNEGSGGRLGALFASKDDAIIRTMTATLVRGADWPNGRETVTAMAKGEFSSTHARLIQVLSFAASFGNNAAFFDSLKSIVEEGLAKGQNTDRPLTAAIAEILAGLVSSGVPFLPKPFNSQSGSNDKNPTAPSSSTLWSEWVGSAFHRALSTCPLDFIDLWGDTALRYAVNGLAISNNLEGLEKVLTLVAEPFFSVVATDDTTPNNNNSTTPSNTTAAVTTAPHGIPSSSAVNTTESSQAVYRRLRCTLHAISEVLTVSGVQRPPKSACTLMSRCLEELTSPEESLVAGGEMVRRAAANVGVGIAVNILSVLPFTNDGGNNNNNGGSSESNMLESVPAFLDGDNDNDAVLVVRSGINPLRQLAARFLADLTVKLQTSTATLYSVFQEHHPLNTTTTSTAAGGVTTDTTAAAMAVLQSVQGGGRAATSSLPEGEHDDDAVVVAAGMGYEDAEVMEEEGDVVGLSQELEEEHQVQGGGEAMAVDSPLTQPSTIKALVTCSYCLEGVLCALFSCTSSASVWLIDQLPSLLALQELIPSEMQFVSLIVKKSLIGLKYQPLDSGSVEKALDILEKSSNASVWPERASSLAFLQYFWFRHCELLGTPGTMRVLAIVLPRLQDSKLEVRELAATTLSGLLKGVSSETAQEVRISALARAKEVFPPGANRKRALNGSGVITSTKTKQSTSLTAAAAKVFTTTERHGAVLALKAFVLSSPYDVPTWLPEVLMALVRLAGEPPPIRTTVASALAEFRRTHQEAGLMEEARQVLSQEQWEAIRDVAAPATYFA